MRVQLTHNYYHVPTDVCCTCGEQFTPDTVSATAYTHAGGEIGTVCDQCLHAGRDVLRRRIQRQAAILRSRAEALEWLAREEITLPVPDDRLAIEPVQAKDDSIDDYIAALWQQGIQQAVVF
jgi:hypothetical protein